MPMSLLNEFAKHCGPGGLSGCTMRQWLRILADNRYAVDFRYWPRAALTTFNSLSNSFWSWREQRFADEIERTQVADPLFVLGVWRSGTTHLHNLLSQDDRFAYPNLYQVLYPHTFLSTESFNASVAAKFLGKTRPMDNVRLRIEGDPQEDEFALAASGFSFINEFAFPRTGSQYRHLMTLRETSQSDIELWKEKLMWFFKKLTLKYQRPLVLKSPGHTARIKILLEMFPNAKFVHIHRHPFRVIQSTWLMATKAFEFWAFQKPEVTMTKLISDYGELCDAFFQQRDLIPKGHLYEIAYDQLVADPMGTLSEAYTKLELPSFVHVEPTLRSYVESIADYQTNKLPPPTKDVQRQLITRLPSAFDEWGYDRVASP